MPAVTAAGLTRAGAGIRAQAVLPDGTLADEFLIEEGDRAARHADLRWVLSCGHLPRVLAGFEPG